MFARFVTSSLRRSPARKAMTIAAVAMGATVATAMLGVMLDVGDQVGRELRSLGANILVTPEAASLDTEIAGVRTQAAGRQNFIAEDQLPRIKRIFWALNVIGFSPSLTARSGDLTVEGLWFNHSYKGPKGTAEQTGVRAVNPSWHVEGQWLSAQGEERECLVGAGLAARRHWGVGSEIPVFGESFRVVGVLESGEAEDDRVIVRLGELQRMTHRENQVEAVQVSALTKPEDAFAHKDPKKMTAEEFERWNCTNYVSSIAHQLAETLPGTAARPVRRVAESEGKVLGKVQGLMLLIAIAALASAALTVTSVTATTMMERRGDIAIMQATGASDWTVSALLFAEVALQGLIGGVIGALAGSQLAGWVGRAVFHVPVSAPLILGPVVILAAVLVAIAGAAQPVRRTLALDPGLVLREGF